MKSKSKKYSHRSLTSRASVRLSLKADKIWNFDRGNFSALESRIDEFRNLGALYWGINMPSQIKYPTYD